MPDDGLTDPMPWYPSKWDNEVLSSEIKQTAESIGLKINQSIGGENLIDNSSFQNDIKGWYTNGASGTYTASVVNDSAAGKCLQLWFSANYCGLFRGLSDQGKAYVCEGATFTVSFDLYKKASVPSQIAVGFEDGGVSASNTINISSHPLNSWKRISVTQTLKTNKASIIIYGLGTGGATVYIRNLKVERGSLATSWSASENERLLDTGIDILNRKMIFTADNTLIQDNTGKQIAMFTTKNGKPLLAAENIDAENLTVSRLLANSSDAPKQIAIDADEAYIRAFALNTYNVSNPTNMYIRPIIDGTTNDYKAYTEIKMTGFQKKTSVPGYTGQINATLTNEELMLEHTGALYKGRYNPSFMKVGATSSAATYSKSFAFGNKGTEVRNGSTYYKGATGSITVNGTTHYFRDGIYIGTSSSGGASLYD